MTQALAIVPPLAAAVLCGECGGRLTCSACAVGDAVQQARLAVAEVVTGRGGRNAMARIHAAKLILAKDFLAYLTDEELLAEVRRRTESKKQEAPGG